MKLMNNEGIDVLSALTDVEVQALKPGNLINCQWAKNFKVGYVSAEHVIAISPESGKDLIIVLSDPLQSKPVIYAANVETAKAVGRVAPIKPTVIGCSYGQQGAIVGTGRGIREMLGQSSRVVESIVPDDDNQYRLSLKIETWAPVKTDTESLYKDSLSGPPKDGTLFRSKDEGAASPKWKLTRWSETSQQFQVVTVNQYGVVRFIGNINPTIWQGL